MTTQPVTIVFYFDFLCPYTYRTMQWLDMVQQQLGDSLVIEWKYFSLEQNNTKTERTLWEQPDDYEPMIEGRGKRSRALLAFWGAEAARQQGNAAFTRFRKALCQARHCDKLDFSERANVELIAEQAELDMEQFRRDFANRNLLDAIRRDHEEAIAKYRAFGVPTLCFDDEHAIYLKMLTVPPAEDAMPFFQELRQSFTARRWLAEIKRPNPDELQ